MPPKTSRAKKSRGSNKLISWLECIQQHTQGVALCAPSSLESEVAALCYTSTGALTKARRDAFERSGLFNCIDAIGVQTLHFLHGKRKNPRELTVTLYGLNSSGKERLRAYERTLIEEPLKELGQQLHQIFATRREIGMQLEIVARIFSELVQVGAQLAEQVKETMQQQQEVLQAQLQTLTDCCQNLPQLPARLDQIREQLQAPLASGGEQANQQWADLWQQLEDPLNKLEQALATKDQAPKRAKIKSLAQKLQKLSQSMPGWEAFLQESLGHLLQGAPLPAQPQEQVATKPSSAGLENQILALVPPDWIAIPDLYTKIREQGIEILPGALNDILLALVESKKLHIGPWTYPLYEIPHPEHGILKSDMQVLYYVRRVV